MNRAAQKAEVAANLVAFEADLPTLVAKSRGKYAAYRHRRLVAIFDSFGEADAYCDNQFDDGLFSIQEITCEPLDTRWLKYDSNEGRILRAHGSDH